MEVAELYEHCLRITEKNEKCKRKLVNDEAMTMYW
jgi:hypothetical protein